MNYAHHKGDLDLSVSKWALFETVGLDWIFGMILLYCHLVQMRMLFHNHYYRPFHEHFILSIAAVSLPNSGKILLDSE